MSGAADRAFPLFRSQNQSPTSRLRALLGLERLPHIHIGAEDHSHNFFAIVRGDPTAKRSSNTGVQPVSTLFQRFVIIKRARSRRAAGGGRMSKRVLVVEDPEDNRQIIRDM